jgi:hypothetical protein
MAADDEKDAQTLLIATPVYASKSLNVDDLEFDQECAYTKLPGKYGERLACCFHSKIVSNLFTSSTQLTNLTTSNSELSIVFRHASMCCNLATTISPCTIMNFYAHLIPVSVIRPFNRLSAVNITSSLFSYFQETSRMRR